MKHTLEQKKIIEHDISSHALVSAVAGSGKTQTLLSRIEYLINQGVNPQKILVLMYNKSAQVEFANRLTKILTPMQASLVNIRTMHSLGNSFLQAFKKSGHISFSKILKEYEVDNIILNSLKIHQRELGITKALDSDRVEVFKEYISLLKSDLSLNNKKIKSLPAKERKLLDKVFLYFNQQCKKHDAITYDDMIYLPVKFFEENKSFISRANNIYSHIIIDEYQDINQVQQFFLNCLAGDNTYVMAVGDVDQTIYQWRGSTPYYMLEGFKKDFNNVKQYQLSYTFRYGDLVSLMANHVISNNKSRDNNLCITYPEIDRKTDVSIIDNTDKVVTKLKDLIASGVKASQIAILVRKYNSTTVFELSCLYNDLQYKVVADKNIFSEPLFKAIYGYLMLLNNGYGFSSHEESQRVEFIKSMLDYPSLYLKKDVKEKLATKISLDPSQASKYIAEVAKDADKPFKEKNILAIAANWRTIYNNTRVKKINKAVDFIFETCSIEKFISKTSSETYHSKSKSQIINGIISFAKSHNKTLNSFINLLHDLYVKSSSQNSEDDDNQIQIMSMHRAKGLEWDYVVVHDATEGGFFGETTEKLNNEIIEEERRLFYVAITRVKKHLYIVSSDDIKRLSKWYGLKTNNYPKDLSYDNSVRFLYEANLTECESFVTKINVVDNKIQKNKLFKKYYEKKFY